MNDWVVITVIYAAVFISGPLMAILHELGHAFAYLIFTKPDRVDIYIGTYNRPQNAIAFEIGKLNFYIKRSFPFVKGIGLCSSSEYEPNYINFIFILLAGPVFTFLIAAILGLIVFSVDAPILVKISCYIFLGFSALSMISNLVPRVIDARGTINLDNDGKQLVFVFKIKKALPIYIEALQFIEKRAFAEAIIKLKTVLEIAPLAEEVLRLIITISIAAKQYAGAGFYLDMLEKNYRLSTADNLQRGILQSLTNNNDDAINTYSKVLKMDTRNLIALNNIGYELIEKGAHEVAKRALDRAIKLKPEFDQPYGNLGYSKILQGDLEEGKTLVDECLTLNPQNADAYKTLGIYYLRMKNVNKASDNFEKAIQLDADLDLGIYSDELKMLAETSEL